LQEAMLITVVAGYLGLIIGIFVLKGIGDNLEEFFIVNPYVDTKIIILATMILIFAGLFAGYVPARRAARIKPIVALRDE